MSREYDSEAKSAMYLAGADRVPHRDVGEALLLDRLPEGPLRVLDLGSGDGRLLSLVLASRPGAGGLAVDVSPPMLERARRRFGPVQGVEVIAHDLREPLPSGWGRFQAVVSSFAIHHLDHVRKRDLYGEVVALLEPGGVFCNLEHVSSASARLHQRFLDCFAAEEDETNILLDVETQLRWLRKLGLIEVDCDWKWRELALLAGARP